MKELPQSLRRIWEIVSSDDYVSGQQRANLIWPIFGPPLWLPDHRLNPIARAELLQQLTPFLHFSSRSTEMKRLEDLEVPDDSERRISYYVKVEVRLAARDSTKSIVDEINKDSQVIELLADLSDDLTSLLKKTLDLFATADKANRDEDPSWSDQPSIAQHAQNHHFSEWSYLIELVRDSFTALTELNPTAAAALLDRWNTIEYPTFRRLIVHALTEWTSQQQ
jgi:hypothetical protein